MTDKHASCGMHACNQLINPFGLSITITMMKSPARVSETKTKIHLDRFDRASVDPEVEGRRALVLLLPLAYPVSTSVDHVGPNTTLFAS